MNKYGIPAIALIVFALAGYSIARTRPVSAKVAPPAAPPAAVYEQKIGAVGLVEASSENIAVSLPVPGLVTAVHVKAGDRVTRGQALFSLDDRDLRAELELRRTAVSVARARLDRLVSLPRPEDIPPAEAKIREAEEQLADAQVQLRLMESVKDKRAIREEDLLRRRVSVRAGEARLAEARANLALLKAGSWEPDIRIARAELAQAEHQVARTQADLDRLTVAAPISGQVLQVKVRVGEFAQAGPLQQPLMLLGAVDELHVRTDIDEHEAWRVKAGAPATASIRGASHRPFALRFVRVEPYVVPKKSLTGDSTERVDTRVLQVIYALERNSPVFAGQQMDVFISAEAPK